MNEGAIDTGRAPLILGPPSVGCIIVGGYSTTTTGARHRQAIKAVLRSPGEQIANELVDWFNQVDATYRTDLRELNELNFARFDAKLEQRLTELDAKWVVRWDKLDAKLEQRLAELDAKWGRQWDRLDGKLEQRLAELDTKLDGKVDRVAAELNATLERRLGEQTRWLFVAWASLLIPIIGLWIRG